MRGYQKFSMVYKIPVMTEDDLVACIIAARKEVHTIPVMLECVYSPWYVATHCAFCYS